MKCKSTLKLLDQYAEGTLPIRQTLMIKYHLKHCKACAKELGDYQQSIRLMKNAFEHIKPESLDSGIWDDIIYQLPESNHPFTEHRNPNPEIRGFIPSLVAFAILLIVLWRADIKQQPANKPMTAQSKPVELPLLEGPPPENTTVMTFECGDSNTRIVWFFKNDNKS